LLGQQSTERDFSASASWVPTINSATITEVSVNQDGPSHTAVIRRDPKISDGNAASAPKDDLLV
jgi:hypothetical protein